MSKMGKELKQSLKEAIAYEKGELKLKKNVVADYSDIKKTFCQKNKYLEELGLKQKDYDFYYDFRSTDKRWKRWQKQRQEYSGVCDADSFDFGLSVLPIYLYTQLRMYKDFTNEALELSQIEYYEIGWEKDINGNWQRKPIFISKTKKEYLDDIIKLLEEVIVYFYKTNGEHVLEYDNTMESSLRLYREEEVYYCKLKLAIKMLSHIVCGLWW